MSLFLVCVCFFVLDASCAPMEDGYETTESFQSAEGEERKLADAQANEKNPVQEWFENLSKNASTTSQNALNSFKEWFSKVSNNPISAPSSNLPTMYMGSFQLIKMPMPQIGDVIKGMGDLATMAQTVNKLTGGGGKPMGLPIPGLQG